MYANGIILIELKISEQRKGVIEEVFLHEFPSKGWSGSGINGLLMQTDARGSAGIIYTHFTISQLHG